jgi:hypothetical protein
VAEPFLEEPELTGAERGRIAAAAVHGAEFALAGMRFRLLCAEPRLLELFREHYGALEVAPDPARPATVAIACGREERTDPHLTLLAGEKAWRIRGEEAVGSAYATIFHLVTLAVRTHYLVHAGCIAVRGRGIVIAAPSGFGKSTLSAHLAVRGAELLSDELAPLERSSGLVSPAPFHVGIRPGVGEHLAQGRTAGAFSFRRDSKKLVPVRSLAGREPAGPVRPHAVVFVTTRPEPSVTTLTKHAGPVRVSFTALAPHFEREVGSLPGLRVLERGCEDALPWLMLEAEDPERAMPALLRLAEGRGVGVAGVRLEGHAGPDFTADPALRRIPAAAGVLELVKKVFPLQLKALVQGEFGGRMAPLVQELAGLLGETAFYKLTPGRLEAMISLLEGLA